MATLPLTGLKSPLPSISNDGTHLPLLATVSMVRYVKTPFTPIPTSGINGPIPLAVFVIAIRFGGGLSGTYGFPT